MDKVSNLFRHWILANKAIVVFCLLLLISTWGGAFMQASWDRQTTIDTAWEENGKFALAFEEHVRRVLKTNEQYLTLLKNEYERRGNTAALQDILRQIAADPLITQTSILNEQGQPVVSALSVNPQSSFADMPHFYSHRKEDTGKLFIGQAALGRVSQKYTIQLSRRINHADGSFGGISTIAISPFYFSRFYNDMKFNENYVVRLTGLDKVIRASNDETEINIDISKAELWNRVAQNSSGFYYGTGPNFKIPRFQSYRVMPDYPLVVQVGIAEASLLPMVRRVRIYYGIAGLMSLFILCFMGFVIAASNKRRRAEQEIQQSYEQLVSSHEELKANEEELRNNYALLNNEREFSAAVIESVPGLLYLYDTDGRLIRWNKNHAIATGYSEQELANMTLMDWYKDDQETIDRISREVATAFEQGVAFAEANLQNKDGSRTAYYLTAVKIMIEAKPYFVGIGIDITKLKQTEATLLVKEQVGRQMEENMEFLRQHDPLTGVYNRAYFENDMAGKKNEPDDSFGVLVCDVDGLKLINDTLGHRQGDELLKQIAMLLDSGIAAPSYAARIGGDELAVVVASATQTTMSQLKEYYQAKIAEHNRNIPQLPLSVSMGWAVGETTVDPDVLFKTADNNMYRQKMHQSQSVRGSIVRTMMVALEEKDHITEGHADRLGDLMERMGRALQLPQAIVADMRLLAKFHDIGKVGIPDGILKKRGKLTDAEMVIMRQHCEIGYRIAKSSPDLEPIADFILKHQEHWDGKGYPLGISGEQIPIECRVLGIVDAFDAMTNDRPYRQAMPDDDALKELLLCAGSQFDAELVNVFISLYHEMKN